MTGAVLDRDFTVDEWGSFAQVIGGDPCPHCGGAGRAGPVGGGGPHVPAG